MTKIEERGMSVASIAVRYYPYVRPLVRIPGPGRYDTLMPIRIQY